MVKVTLIRALSSEVGTFGVLALGGKPICVTAEPPWKDNKPNVSCIPDGRYACSKHSGVKYKNVWALANVKNREAILLHNGNFSLTDTEGCILVGSSYIMGARSGVSDSVKTLDMLRKLLPNEFELEITWGSQRS